MHKQIKKALASILCVCLLVTMMPAAAFAADDSKVDSKTVPAESVLASPEELEKEPMPSFKEADEVTEEDAVWDECGENYTTFSLGGDKRLTIFFSENVRYEDESGDLVDYDPSLIEMDQKASESENRDGYAYKNASGDSDLFIPETLSEDTPILMEKDAYAISMIPTEKTYKDFFGKTVKIKTKKAKVKDAYDQETEKNVKASYKDETALAYIEYTSKNYGVKEEIVLNKRPAKNVMEFEITAKGMTPVISDEDGSIGFYDQKTGELVNMIDPPNMNDATGDAYSEALFYEIAEKEGTEDTYILTLTIDKDYLKAKKRVYPVTIDPAAEWVGDAALRDVYVSSASPNTNYYSTARMSMPVGKGSSSTFRTYINFLNLKSRIQDSIVDTAYLNVYENSDSYSGRTIRAYRVTASWTATGLKWNAQPATASSYTASLTTTGIDKRESYFNLRTFVRSVADGGSNYGVMLRNAQETSTGYAEFYGSRSSSSSYRPNLYVEYTSATAVPNLYLDTTSLTGSGQQLKISYNNLASSLTSVEYLVTNASGTVMNSSGTYEAVPSGNSPAAAGIAIPMTGSLPDGTYQIKIKATYYNGKTVTSAAKTFTANRQAPGTPVVTVSSDVITDDQGTYVTWSGVTGNVARIEYKVVPCNAYGTPISPGSVSYSTLSSVGAATGSVRILRNTSLEDGKYAVYVRAIGTNGKVSNEAYKVITINRTAPEATVNLTEMERYAYISWYVNTSLHSDFARVEILLDGSLYATSTSSSGNKFFWFHDLEEAQNYDVTLIVYDESGNYTEYESSFYVPYMDYAEPEIGEVTLTHSDGTAINEANWYTKETGTFTIGYQGIKDTGSGINTSTIRCQVYKNGDTRSPIATLTATSPAYSSGAYSGSFSLPMGSLFADSGKYTFALSVSDFAGNTASKTVIYQKDSLPPEGSITVKDATVDKTVSELRDMVRISAEVSDKDSGIKSANLVLKNLGTGDIATLISNITESNTVNFDTTTLPNGNYQLILSMTDHVNLTKTETVNMTLDNRIQAPILTTSVTGGEVAAIGWRYSTAMDKLASLQYSVDDGATWVDVSIGENKQSGIFHVTLPEATSGSYPVIVRGVDLDGIAGKEKTITCRVDATGPTVAIDSLENGVLKGTISDANLSSWQIAVKPKDGEDSAYIVVAEGTDAVKNGRIGIVDLSDASYLMDTWYTVKVTAIDQLGNVSSATCDVLKDSNYQSASLVSSFLRIERSTNQSYKGSRFIIGTETTSLHLLGLVSGTVKWFVNNTLVSSEEIYSDNFASKYTEGTDYQIAVLVVDGDGDRKYSNSLIQNGASYAADWTNAVGTETEKEITIDLTEPAVSFQFNGPAADADGNAVSYQVKIGEGDYQSLTPGTKIHVNDMTETTLTADSITVKAAVQSAAAWDTLEAAVLSVDLLDEEVFQMSGVENYAPKNLAVEEGLNYKSYIKWQTNSSNALPENVYYEVYRGTTPDFVPDISTLAAGDVKANYWSEINVNFSDTFYYKVRAVKKDSEGNVIAASTFSHEMAGTVVSYDEYVKRLGLKGYWAYGELDVPESTVSVELSKGNLVYTQVDGTITNQLLAVELTRAYNSQATSKGAFGYGWTHSYDMELLSLCESDELNEGAIILKDGNGTLFWFERAEDGTYISSLGKYVKLEKAEKKEVVTLPSQDGGTITTEVNSAYTITTKDKTECRFNSGGQLVYLADHDGNVVLVDYDANYGVITKVTTGQNVSVTFDYDAQETGDPLLIHQVTMPDGQALQYDYENGHLIKVTRLGDAADDTDDISYEYGYGTDGYMNVLKDAMGNAYSFDYDGYNRVSEVTYPSTADSSGNAHTEKIQMTYETNGSDNTKTITTRLVDGSAVASETDQFESSFGSRTKHTDAEGYTTEFTFQDNLPLETKYEVQYEVIADGIVQMKTSTKTENTSYNENQDVKLKKDAADTVTEVTFYETAGKEHLIRELWERTASNVLVTHESYEYDSHDNVTKVTDHLNNMITVTTYSYVGAVKGQVATRKVYLVKDGENHLQTESSTSYAYNSQGNLVETRTETGGGVTVTTVTTYDPAGKKLSENYTYQKSGEAQSTKTVAYAYDTLGRPVSVTTTESASGAESVQLTETYTYDKNSNVIKKVDFDGTIHTYTYDASDDQVAESLTKGTHSKSWTTSYQYEDVTIHTGIGGTKAYSDAYVTTQTLQSGADSLVMSKTWQDSLGRTIREVSDGIQTDYVYDGQGQVLSTYSVGLKENGTEDTSTAKHVLTLYDASGNQTSTIQMPVYTSGEYSVGENSIVTSKTYDERGNVLRSTDGMGAENQYTYDANGEVTSVTLPNGAKTTYAYDVFDSSDNSTRTVTTYANGAVSETKYNATGQIISVTDKGKSDENLTEVVKSYTYDARGNITRETYTKGNYKTYEYDARDRVTAVNYYETAAGTVSMRTEYTYNTADAITSMKDYTYDGGSKALYRYTGYTYDQFNRLEGKTELNTQTEPTAAQISAAKITYEYDINDKVTAVNYPAIGNTAAQKLTYVYDENQRLTSVKRTSGSTTKTIRNYTYYNDGALHEATADGITETHTYDAFGRPTAKVYTYGGVEKEKHTYTYDKNNAILTEGIVNNWPTQSSAKVNETRTYTYDEIGQLTKSVVTGSKSETTVYTYDAVGNRTSETIGSKVTNYGYDSLNRLQREQVTGSGTGDGTITYEYDDNGNLISKESSAGITETFAYDAADQMKTYSNGSLTQTNVYNGEGQRISKKEGSTVTNYFYDDSGLLYSTDGSGGLKAFQLYDGNGDQFATLRAGGSLYYYTDDSRGSIVNLVDESGSAVVSYTYTDYGETAESQGGSFDNEIRFTGGVYDESTGLYYLNARFYDPASGRFLNPDSYRGEAADPQSLHLYAYCANNPVNMVDPTGHVVETILDVVFLKISLDDYLESPTLTNFAYVVWDGVATIAPFLPGSYTAKGVKYLTKADITNDLWKQGVRITSKGAETVKTAKAGKKVVKYVSSKKGKTYKKVSKAISHSVQAIKGLSYDISKLYRIQPYATKAEIRGIKEQILRFGPNSVPPIYVYVLQGKAIVIDGHHRLQAFRELGYKRVPIKYVREGYVWKNYGFTKSDLLKMIYQ